MADTKISALPDADPLDGSEVILLSQSGSDAKEDLLTLREYYLGEALYSGLWVRPASWMPMPASAPNQVVLCCAVFDDPNADMNFIALKCVTSSGTYSVDWGDGTSSTGVASNSNAQANLSYSGAPGVLTERGYKTCIVTVTADSGNITSFVIGGTTGVVHSSLSATPNYTVHVLDLEANLPSATSIVLGGAVSSNQNLRKCERVIITDAALSSSGANYIAGNLNSLRVLVFGADIWTASPSSTIWSNAPDLIPFMDWGATQAGWTTLSGSVVLPSAVGFGDVTIPSDWKPTTASQILTCFGARTIEIGSAFLANVGTAASITISGSISELTMDWASLVSGFTGAISVTNNLLSAEQLDAIYTALPSRSATIIVTGNPGTVGDDPSIATAKGWTVTG